MHSHLIDNQRWSHGIVVDDDDSDLRLFKEMKSGAAELLSAKLLPGNWWSFSGTHIPKYD
jgi:hypothetical protein